MYFFFFYTSKNKKDLSLSINEILQSFFFQLLELFRPQYVNIHTPYLARTSRIGDPLSEKERQSCVNVMSRLRNDSGKFWVRLDSLKVILLEGHLACVMAHEVSALFSPSKRSLDNKKTFLFLFFGSNARQVKWMLANFSQPLKQQVIMTLT